MLNENLKFRSGCRQTGMGWGAGTLIALWAASSLLLTSSCATVTEPSITLPPTAPMHSDYPYFVTTAGSANQKENIIRSMKAAGLTVEAEPREKFYTLEVTLGQVRSTNECGSLRNVIYRVTQMGARIMVIKGRGWTGNCTPGIYDEMSKILASRARG
ncbi:hypothetical protein MK280_06860 [Myxococcota bacterium]|nr:hypothetical protein [Myxococcota bacterium]